ncbi:kelch-like protein [Chloroflexi bacterium TSY]|nr:kelch-like protein [Chloroflexi bacterium TSY]
MIKSTYTIIFAGLLFINGCANTIATVQNETTTPVQPDESSIGTDEASNANVKSSVWERRAPLLEANSELSVTELDGFIYVMGGYPSSRQTVDTVQIYDTALDSWRLGPPLPVASNHNVAAAVDGLVYIIGGQPTARGGGPFLQDVFAYDPSTDSWSERAPMPTWRSGSAGAVLNGKIYVAGGRPPHGHDFAVYDPQNDEWTTLPNMPTARNHFVVVTIMDEIYAIGGRFGAGFSSEVTDIVEIYNPETNEWRRGTPMLTKRSGHNGIVANGCLHVMGGEGNGAGNVNGLYPQHEVYDPGSVDPNLAFLAIFSRDCRDFGVIYSDFGYRKQPISYLKIAQI